MVGEQSQSRAAEVARLYASGQTTRGIAAQLGVHEATVRRDLDRRRRSGPRGRTDVTDEQIVQMRDQDEMSWPEIAAAVGMSRTGVRVRYRVATDGKRWR